MPDRARLLYLENSPRSDVRTGVVERLSGMGLEIDRVPAYRGEFPTDLSEYDGAYLTGSPHGAYDDVPWIHQEHEVIADIAAAGIPTLGVCFGSQVLASALCGRDEVFRRSDCEVGYVTLALLEAALRDPLMEGVPNPVRMFVWHNDEVRPTHPDMTLLAMSADCPNHIWRYRDEPIWGIQGHPEVTCVTAPAFLDDHRATLERDGAKVEALIVDRGADPAVDLFLENFAREVLARRRTFGR